MPSVKDFSEPAPDLVYYLTPDDVVTASISVQRGSDFSGAFYDVALCSRDFGTFTRRLLVMECDEPAKEAARSLVSLGYPAFEGFNLDDFCKFEDLDPTELRSRVAYRSAMRLGRAIVSFMDPAEREALFA